MKVYVITSGEYSDYHIVAIFTDKQKAHEFMDNANYFRDYGYDNGVDIMEMDTDMKHNKRPTTAVVYAEFVNGTLMDGDYFDVGSNPSGSDMEYYTKHEDKEVVRFVITIRDGESYDDLCERSKKVAIDKYYTYKARGGVFEEV